MPSSKLKKYPIFKWQALRPIPVIGVDEVGRGCLAGPVYAAAVIIDPKQDLSYLTDSKLLSEARREEFAQKIFAFHQCAVCFATVEEIDRFNILQASLLAMKRAVEKLAQSIELPLNANELRGHVIVDGNQKIPELSDFAQTTVIKGDLRAQPISAASIIAKVTRDSVMRELAREFPNYGFEKHKGYSTAEHKLAIKKFGPCRFHRRTFAGVREYLPS